jgi:diguanylate cyclase
MDSRVTAAGEMGSATNALARAALLELEARSIAPTPENCAVWCAFVAGTNAKLSETINLVIAKGAPFGEELNQTLFEAFCLPEQAKPIVERNTVALRKTADQILASLGGVDENVQIYNKALDTFKTNLSGSHMERNVAVSKLFAETRRMQAENMRLQTELVQATTQVEGMKGKLDELCRDTLTDALTNIANRRAFDQTLVAAVADAHRQAKPLSLIMLDIDHFKRFNDTHGHQVGDEVLKLVARTLTESVKGRDTAARFGGEEFSIILPATAPEAGAIVAEQVRNAIASRRIVRRTNGEDLGSVTLSLGVASLLDGESAEALIARADAALYKAKRSGRNRVVVAEESVRATEIVPA